MSNGLDIKDDLFNPPNQENPPESEPERADTETAKCPSCGANLVYSPEIHGLKCPYCGTEEKLAEDNFCEEQDFEKLFTDRAGEWADETKVFRCTNCGATTVISRSELSKECAFCGTSNIVEREDISGMRPDAVLPFLLTKENAGERLKAWAKKKIFAPSSFKKSVKPEKIYGNYSPSFTFDSDTVSPYVGRLGKYYYTTRMVNGKTVRTRHIRYYNISGTHRARFDDVLVQAANNIPQKTLDKIQPFDTNNSQEYSADYLHGFSATQYDRDGKECWKVAQSIMYENVKKQILAGYSYDVVGYLDVRMNCHNITYKYVLLPLYVGHYKFKQKLYNFFVNGRNGKVAGKSPLSPIRVGFVVLIALGILAGIIYWFISQNGGI